MMQNAKITNRYLKSISPKDITPKKAFFRAKSYRVIENTFYYSTNLKVYNKPFPR